MLQILAPVTVKDKDVIFDIPTKSNTLAVIKEYQYKTFDDVQYASSSFGKKPYITTQITQKDLDNGFALGFIAGEITDVFDTRITIKPPYGAYTTVFLSKTDTKTYTTGSTVAVLGNVSISEYKNKTQFTVFARDISVLIEGAESGDEDW